MISTVVYLLEFNGCWNCYSTNFWIIFIRLHLQDAWWCLFLDCVSACSRSLHTLVLPAKMKHEHNGTEPILSFKLVWLCQARFRWFYEVYKVYTAFLTIKAQMPLTFRARLSLWVRLHSNSITPDSSIGCTKQNKSFQYSSCKSSSFY